MNLSLPKIWTAQHQHMHLLLPFFLQFTYIKLEIHKKQLEGFWNLKCQNSIDQNNFETSSWVNKVEFVSNTYIVNTETLQ